MADEDERDPDSDSERDDASPEGDDASAPATASDPPPPRRRSRFGRSLLMLGGATWAIAAAVHCAGPPAGEPLTVGTVKPEPQAAVVEPEEPAPEPAASAP